MVIATSIMNINFGSMKEHERLAQKGDVFGGREIIIDKNIVSSSKGKVIDLVLPVIMLIIFCITGMIYSGGFFDIGNKNFHNFINAFAGSNASVGLVIGLTQQY